MASVLSRPELDFLRSQGLSEADVYDGRYESSIEARGRRAKEASKLIVLRDPIRSRCGHRLTTRKGHCVQCDTSKISYAKRHEEPAFVYIAGSGKSQLIKIGVTQDISQRLDNLNSQRYAEASDWEMLFYVRFKRAGAVETTAQSQLSDFGEMRSALRDCRDQTSREVFNCGFDHAYKTIARVAQSFNLKPEGEAWKSARATLF